jgi:hypothetical protein
MRGPKMGYPAGVRLFDQSLETRVQNRRGTATVSHKGAWLSQSETSFYATFAEARFYLDCPTTQSRGKMP